LKAYQSGYVAKLLMPKSKRFRGIFPFLLVKHLSHQTLSGRICRLRLEQKHTIVFTTIVTRNVALVISGVCLKGVKEGLFQDGGAALCLEAPDVDDPNVQELTLWYLYTSSNAKYQTILACYCQKRLEVAREYCAPYLLTQTRVQALSITAILGVIVINAVLTNVLKCVCNI